MRAAAGIVLVAGLALTGGAVPAAAQQAEPALPPTAVLTIDQEDLFRRSAFGLRLSTEVEQAAAALAAENRRIEAELTAEELDLTSRRATLPPEDFRRLAEAFDARVVAIRRSQDSKERALAQAEDEARRAFWQAALPVLARLAAERGALVILDSRAVLIAVESLDSTEAARQRIDAELGDGRALFRLPAADDPAPAPPAP